MDSGDNCAFRHIATLRSAHWICLRTLINRLPTAARRVDECVERLDIPPVNVDVSG